jgi:hypothetical protein
MLSIRRSSFFFCFSAKGCQGQEKGDFFKMVLALLPNSSIYFLAASILLSIQDKQIHFSRALTLDTTTLADSSASAAPAQVHAEAEVRRRGSVFALLSQQQQQQQQQQTLTASTTQPSV